jgi:thymidylate kinase
VTTLLPCETPEPFLISFSGMDGAGKSTQIQILCAELASAGVPVMQLAFWDHVAAFARLRANFSIKFLKSDGRVGTPAQPVRRNDKNARIWYLVAARTFLYAIDAMMLRRIVKRTQKRFSGVIVFDRYIYDQLATLPLENIWAQAYARLLLRFVPRPDLPFVLDAVPEEARERKPEYPLEFLYRYRGAYVRLSTLAGLTLIDPMSQDATSDVVTGCLRNAAGSSEVGSHEKFEPQKDDMNLLATLSENSHGT